jgi:hypothetical protein
MSIKPRKSVELLLALGLAATVAACEAPVNDADETPTGTDTPSEVTPGVEPENDEEEGEEDGEGGEGGEG